MPYYDIYYLILVIPALIFGIWAQSCVNRNFEKYRKIGTVRGMTGAQAAQYILEQNGIYNVRICRISGHLSDNFDSRNNTISLSDSVYDSTSVAAVGVAAHEAGHAVQYAVGYKPIKIRSAIIPITQVGSKLYFPIIILGIIMSSQYLVDLGIILFATIAIFQLATLPVEFNASNRAIKALENSGIIYGEEINGVKNVLKAAALTYVAALVSSLAQLLRLVLIYGNRRKD